MVMVYKLDEGESNLLHKKAIPKFQLFTIIILFLCLELAKYPFQKYTQPIRNYPLISLLLFRPLFLYFVPVAQVC